MHTTTTLQYLFLRIVVGALGLASYMAFSRLVPPEQYAQYALVLATANAVVAFCYAWLGISALRLVQTTTGEHDAYVSGVFLGFAMVSVPVLMAMLLVFLAFRGWFSLTVALFVPTITILLAWFELSLYLSRARVQTGAFGGKTLVRSGLTLGLGVALTLLGWQALGLLLAYAIGLLAAIAYGFRADSAGASPLRTDPVALRRMFDYGWPVAFGLGLSWVIDFSDRFLILALLGEATAGEYALVYDVARHPLWLLMSAASLATLPLAARAYERGGDIAGRAVLAQSLTLLLLVSAPLVAVEVLFAPELAAVLLGEQYRDAAAAVMPLVAVAVLINGLRGFYLDISMHLAGRTRGIVIMWAVAAAANVLLNLVMIPAFGIVGAALSTVLAHLLAVVIFLLRVERADVLAMSVGDLAKVGAALAALLMVLGADLLPTGRSWFLVQFGAGGCLYVIVILALNPGQLRQSLVSSLPGCRGGTCSGPQF